MIKDSKYLPVDPDFLERIEQVKREGKKVKIFIFTGPESIDAVTGIILGIIKVGRAEFCQVSGEDIRLDRIITLDGRPGPAYDAYDAFANACLSCKQDS